MSSILVSHQTKAAALRNPCNPSQSTLSFLSVWSFFFYRKMNKSLKRIHLPQIFFHFKLFSNLFIYLDYHVMPLISPSRGLLSLPPLCNDS